MTKKTWGSFIIIVLGAIIFILGAFHWTLVRQELVVEGLAKPFFPYLRYNDVELEDLYSSHDGANVATTQTPEETHRIFIDNLKKKNIDAAVECCFLQGDWEERKKFFTDIKNKGYWDIMVKDLDTELINTLTLDSTASYEYTAEYDGKKYASSISFSKNKKGEWLIKSL